MDIYIIGGREAREKVGDFLYEEQGYSVVYKDSLDLALDIENGEKPSAIVVVDGEVPDLNGLGIPVFHAKDLDLLSYNLRDLRL